MRVSKDFGLLIVEIKGEDSFGQAAIKTQISKAYLVEIAAGKVPRPETIKRFADGYQVPAGNARRLYDLAGYAIPAEWQPGPEASAMALADRVRERIAEYLVTRKGMSQQEVITMFQEIESGEE